MTDDNGNVNEADGEYEDFGKVTDWRVPSSGG